MKRWTRMALATAALTTGCGQSPPPKAPLARAHETVEVPSGQPVPSVDAMPNSAHQPCFAAGTPQIGLGRDSHHYTRDGIQVSREALVQWLDKRYRNAPLRQRAIRLTRELANTPNEMKWMLPLLQELEAFPYVGGEICPPAGTRPSA